MKVMFIETVLRAIENLVPGIAEVYKVGMPRWNLTPEAQLAT
jgi:hypothetical protein